MERRVPDISKIVACTGYRPRYSLDEMLGRIHEWFVGENVLERSVVFQHAAAATA
jgi:nucleoside-diphosphate-sugar epimerase